jgi:hypothetical protein
MSKSAAKGQGMSPGDEDRFNSIPSDSAIVAAALERQIVAAALERQILPAALRQSDPRESKSVFIPLTTATIPISVESGPNDDWTCRFVFDHPQVHSDGTVEYRVRC